MTTDNLKPEEPRQSDAYLIEIERQKTVRARNKYLFFGGVILSALISLYFMLSTGGKGGIDVNLKEGSFKFNVDKSVVEQAKIETKTYKTPEGKNIDYTTGRIKQKVLTDFSNENISFSPNYFVGKNLINDAAGYIVSSSDPDMWSIQYNPAGLSNPLIPINTFIALDGSHLNVTRETITYPTIQEYINAATSMLVNYGAIDGYPDVSYANDGRTAFLTFTNVTTNGQSYMKVIQGHSYYNIATANYNLDYSAVNTREELVRMVANFTLIE